MIAQERINVRETVGKRNNCKVNFFSIYFVRTKEEIHLSFKNSERIYMYIYIYNIYIYICIYICIYIYTHQAFIQALLSTAVFLSKIEFFCSLLSQ